MTDEDRPDGLARSRPADSLSPGLSAAEAREVVQPLAVDLEVHEVRYLDQAGANGFSCDPRDGRHWLEDHGALVAPTPQKSAWRAWTDEACIWAAGKRQIIEGVIWQLKDLFGLERHRAENLGGLLARLAAKVAAYTCGQMLNAALGRPPRGLASLLVLAIAHQRS
jgi:hypothetical protein